MLENEHENGSLKEPRVVISYHKLAKLSSSGPKSLRPETQLVNTPEQSFELFQATIHMLILKHSFKHSLKLSSEPFAAPKAYAGLV